MPRRSEFPLRTCGSCSQDAEIVQSFSLVTRPLNTNKAQTMSNCRKADDAVGMTWWNGLTRCERLAALSNATAALGHEASAAEAWRLWKTGQISLK